MTGKSYAPQVENVLYRQIGRKMLSGGKETAAFTTHKKETPKPGDDVWKLVEAHAKGHGNPNPGPWPNHTYSQLSVEATKGRNLYLIAIDPNAHTKFGPGPSPIQIMPPGFGTGLIEEIALIHVDSNGQVLRMEAKDIPTDIRLVPDNAMLSFVCDRAELLKEWDRVVTGAGHSGSPMRIPFFLNLWDSHTNLPVWTYGVEAHAEHREDHSHIFTHGGIHPSDPTNDFY